jgi:hypothetical protein
MTNAKWCEYLTLPLARWAKDHMIYFLLQKFYCETTPMSALHNIEHFVTKHNDVQNRNRFISKKHFLQNYIFTVHITNHNFSLFLNYNLVYDSLSKIEE